MIGATFSGFFLFFNAVARIMTIATIKLFGTSAATASAWEVAASETKRTATKRFVF